MLKNRSLRTRRFVAKYVTYVEVFGYLFVATLAAGIFAAWFFRVDDVVKDDASKNPEIAPKEIAVKDANDAYITRLFVTDKFQSVKKGQPLVEVIDDPEWVERFRVVGHLKAALADWTELEKKLSSDDGPTGSQKAKGKGQKAKGKKQKAKAVPPASNTQATADGDSATKGAGPPTSNPQPPTPDAEATEPASPLAAPDLQLKTTVEQAVTEWDQTTGASAPRRVLRAPHDGVVVFDEKLPGQVVAGKQQIVKIADFGELQVKYKLKGANIPDTRVGQLAYIEVRPVQPPSRVIRGDREGFLWRAERVQFSKPLDKSMKNWLRDELKKQPVTADDHEDMALEVKDVERVEVDAKLKTTPVSTAAVAGAGKKDRLKPDILHLMDLRGHVSEAKHIGKLTLNESNLPPRIAVPLYQKLLEKVKGKVVEDPHPFRIDGFRSLAVTVQVSIETTKTPKNDREREQQLKNALEAKKDERFVEATVTLDNPPPELTKAIEAQYEKDSPSGPRADVNVVTDRRRFAALLFRKSSGEKSSSGGD